MPLNSGGSASNAVTPKKLTLNSKPVLNTVSSPTPLRTTSLVGDILRGVVNNATDGHFGNGNAVQRQAETQSEYLNRLAQAAGAAAETFNNTSTQSSKSTNMADSLKAGVTQEAVTGAITKFLPIAVIGVVGFWAAKKFIFKKGGKRPRY